MGESSAVFDLNNAVKKTVSGIDWIRLDWQCSTPSVTSGLLAVDLAAIDLNVNKFSLRHNDFQTLLFTARIGIATTSENGNFSLSTLASSENGPKFKYSFYLSVDETWSHEDFHIPLNETLRRNEVLKNMYDIILCLLYWS